MTKKSFFRERSAAEIRHLSAKQVYSPRGLVERIDGLDPSSEAIELRTRIIPGNFYINTENSAQAARKCYKHGDLIALSQPKGQGEAYECPDIPLAIRARDFAALGKMKEEEINFMGYSFRPVQGDKRKRVVPFVWLPEAERVFAYSENMSDGIEVKPYADARRVFRQGADVICKVPSRSKKKSKYTIRLQNVPVLGVTEKRAVVWGVKPHYERGEEPEHSTFNIKYTYESDREGSDVVTFYPHDIAAYIATAAHFWKKHNLTPMEMNPFALFSRKGVDFYKKLCNNVVIYDPTLSSKSKLRKLNIAEKSIMLGRGIGKFGHDEFAFWNPERDGKLKDYNWGI